MKFFYIKLILISQILFCLVITVCLAQPSKKPIDSSRSISSSSGSSLAKSNTQLPAECYTFLTELVRSSSFPFNTWGIESKKVKLLIDQDDGNKIEARLFWETEGTGTMGWIEYDIKQSRLRDISANLDSPTELSFNANYGNLFSKCRQPKSAIIKNTSESTNKLKSDFDSVRRISLPVSMDQISILDYPVPAAYQKLQIEDSRPISMAAIGNGVVILFFEGDTERWYLATLDEAKIIDYLLIGKSETVENESGMIDNFIVFTIDTHGNIELEYSSGINFNKRKILKKERYFITPKRKIMKSTKR